MFKVKFGDNPLNDIVLVKILFYLCVSAFSFCLTMKHFLKVFKVSAFINELSVNKRGVFEMQMWICYENHDLQSLYD